MRRISEWNEILSKIKYAVREVKGLVAEYEINPLNLNAYAQEQSAADLTFDLKRIFKTIAKQHDERALYTLDSINPNPVKLPTFARHESEDFNKFKEKIN